PSRPPGTVAAGVADRSRGAALEPASVGRQYRVQPALPRSRTSCRQALSTDSRSSAVAEPVKRAVAHSRKRPASSRWLSSKNGQSRKLCDDGKGQSPSKRGCCFVTKAR